jgi:hypothetical protein
MMKSPPPIILALVGGLFCAILILLALHRSIATIDADLSAFKRLHVAPAAMVLAGRERGASAGADASRSSRAASEPLVSGSDQHASAASRQAADASESPTAPPLAQRFALAAQVLATAPLPSMRLELDHRTPRLVDDRDSHARLPPITSAAASVAAATSARSAAVTNVRDDLDCDAADRDALSPTIDAVVTFVNAADPQWRAAHDAALAESKRAAHSEMSPTANATGKTAPTSAASAAAFAIDAATSFGAAPNRFRDWGELRFALRSLHTHARSFVRRIHLVVAARSQVPAWLDAEHPAVRIVLHRDLFPRPALELPTFNSLAIESVLHRIPGLSNHFLYLNNDVMLMQPTSLETFATNRTYKRCEIDEAIRVNGRFDEAFTMSLLFVCRILILRLFCF